MCASPRSGAGRAGSRSSARPRWRPWEGGRAFNAEAALARLLENSAGALLLIDDADGVSNTTLRALLEYCVRTPEVQAVVVRTELETPIDARVVQVDLTEPMSRAETDAYVQARLAMVVAPREVLARFGWSARRRLARASGGNPRKVHELARAVLDPASAPAPPPAPERAARGSGQRVVASAVALLGLGVLLGLAWRALHLETPGRGAEPVSTAGGPAAAPLEAAPRPPAPQGAGGADGPRPAAGPVPAPLPPVETRLAGDGRRPPAPEPIRTARSREPEVAAPPARERSAPAPPPAPAPDPAPARRAPRPPAVVESPAPAPVAAIRPDPPPPAQAEPPARPAARAPAPPVRSNPPDGDEVGLDGFRLVQVRDGRLGQVPGPEQGRVPVFVNAVPSAEIEIDGHEIGRTPIVGLPVPPGPRRFVAVFANGTRLERQVEVDGEEVHVLFP